MFDCLDEDVASVEFKGQLSALQTNNMLCVGQWVSVLSEFTTADHHLSIRTPGKIVEMLEEDNAGRVWFPSLKQTLEVGARDLVRLEIVEAPVFFIAPQDTTCQHCSREFAAAALFAPSADTQAYCCAGCWRKHLRDMLINYVWTTKVDDHTSDELTWNGQAITDRFLGHMLSGEERLVEDYLAVQRAKVSCEDPEHPRPCHGCKRLLFKYVACDHVKCPCGAEMCWKCGGKYSHPDGPCPGHFNPETPAQLRDRLYSRPALTRLQNVFRSSRISKNRYVNEKEAALATIRVLSVSKLKSD